MRRHSAYRSTVITTTGLMKTVIMISRTLDSFICILEMLAVNVSDMKKKVSSISLVTPAAFQTPLLLFTIDIFAIND